MIRPTTTADLPALKALIDTLELFPGEMPGDMMADYFTSPDSRDCWLTNDGNGPVGVAYYAPERLTDGTWNLYLIAIQADRQGQGRGVAMMRYVEHDLRTRGERMLLVETSGLPSYEYQSGGSTGGAATPKKPTFEISTRRAKTRSFSGRR